uniref:IF rod domain-containing protein n=1 Tax=Denticeps clupeoides TaxID=299321 RepID=A0AAY3ZVL7_9TELE
MASVAAAGSGRQQMLQLNGRLAAYLDAVRRLQEANGELEEKVRALAARKVVTRHALRAHDPRLTPVREQLTELIRENGRITLAIESAKLAAEDFRLRYESELSMRQMAESDLLSLKVLKRQYEATTRGTLVRDHKALTEEKIALQKNHEEEITSLRKLIASRTTKVDVKATEAVSLAQAMTDIRSAYETMIQRSCSEVEDWYQKQVELKQTGSVVPQGSPRTAALTQGQKQSLTLRVELEALLMLRANLEQRLLEVQREYQGKLHSLSQAAVKLEGELAGLRKNVLQQGIDYQVLLSTKVQLEHEILSYKALLEGASIETRPISSSVTSIKLSANERISDTSPLMPSPHALSSSSSSTVEVRQTTDLEGSPDKMMLLHGNSSNCPDEGSADTAGPTDVRSRSPEVLPVSSGLTAEARGEATLESSLVVETSSSEDPSCIEAALDCGDSVFTSVIMSVESEGSLDFLSSAELMGPVSESMLLSLEDTMEGSGAVSGDMMTTEGLVTSRCTVNSGDVLGTGTSDGLVLSAGVLTEGGSLSSSSVLSSSSSQGSSDRGRLLRQSVCEIHTIT